MNKRDFTILFTPIFVLVIIGATALMGAHECNRLSQVGDGHQKYETFVQNVQSGRWQITTDRWLTIMRVHQATRAWMSEFEADGRELLLLLALMALLGIISQVYTIRYIRKRFVKP
jgi:hypothetical protein